MAEEHPQANSSKSETAARNPSQPVNAREEQQYIIAAKPAGALHPMLAPVAPKTIEDALRSDPRVQYLRTIRLQPGLTSLTLDPFAPQDVYVVRTTPKTAADISQHIGHLAYIERDEPLRIAPASPATLGNVRPGPGAGALTATTLRVAITVAGKNLTPLPDAHVVIFGSQSGTQGVTDQAGQVALTLPGETGETVRGIAVTPRANYWSAWVPNPLLSTGGSFTVTLASLDQAFPDADFPGFPGFPSRGVTGWGLSAMHADQLQPEWRGQGITIGLVDTGVAAGTHSDLAGQITGGYNVVEQDPASWDRDKEGHGTHCAGVIAALDNGQGVRGIAPGAKLYSYTAFPGCRYSTLIDALNCCIRDNVDIINLSLGTDVISDLVEQKIQQAKQYGIACIAAAGNESGAVQFPACSPNVLGVAAVGRQGTFPPGTWQRAEAATSNDSGPMTSADGFFSPAFTCFGPGISLCAPGAAVLSCYPPNDYAVMDGTSIAAAHVTGLAALVLAHHPDFQGPYRERNARRVDRLFQILMLGARPLALGAPSTALPRTGAGLADAARALGVPAAAAAPGVNPQTWAEVTRSLLRSNGHSTRVRGSATGAELVGAAVAPTAGFAAGAQTPNPAEVADLVSAVAAEITRSMLTR